MEKEQNKQKNNIGSSIGKGILFSIIPHIGCIAFAVLMITGVGLGTAFLKNFLSSKWIFPASIILSFVIASVYSYLYFKKQCCTNKVRHISILFSSMILVNVLLFYVVFPWMTNIKSGQNIALASNLSELRIQVEIPCTGHAPLIVYELKKAGVSDVTFSDPDTFDIKYDSTKITPEQIKGLQLFEDFKIKKFL
ncbi:MAG: MerC domain-containing protein [Candidatus Paceibacterota bacterium]